MSEKTLIFIPTYNERGNVERLLSQILAQKVGCDVLFMDDNSPDGTGHLLDRLALRYPGVQVLHRPGKQGIGSAHREGIRWAYDMGYTLLITMDCDFTHPPEDLPRFIQVDSRLDVVIGSRYLLRHSLAEWTVFRRCVTYGAHLLTRFLLRMNQDASSAYRLYRLSRIRRTVFDRVRFDGYEFFFESLYRLSADRYRVGEIPIVLPARACGKSKMTVRDAWRGLARLGILWWSIRRRSRVDPAEG